MTIKSSTEFNYIKSQISPNYWIGASDSASEGTRILSSSEAKDIYSYASHVTHY